MNSRMNKYSQENKLSRVSKNASLYKEINESELDNFSVKSNATVIGNQEPEIDIEKIKKILDMKYNEAPKRKSIRIEPRTEEKNIEDDVPTKEYDLNVILEKAKDEKKESYEEARAKKLRNTQFDILNNLNIANDDADESDKMPSETEEDAPEMSKAEEDLMELINTITINEAKIKEAREKENDNSNDSDPLDILKDLKGSEGTAVYGNMAEDIQKELAKQEEKNIEENVEKEEEKKETSVIDTSFYTTTSFAKKDFEDDSDDFLDDNKLSIWLKLLIAAVVIVFAVGLFLFLRSFLNF